MSMARSWVLPGSSNQSFSGSDTRWEIDTLHQLVKLLMGAYSLGESAS